MKIKIHIVLFFVLFAFQAISQQDKTKKKKNDNQLPTYFGLQVRPIFPARFIGEQSFVSSSDGFSTTFSQRYGYSFGATIRKNITKLIAIESGINYNERHFSIEASVADLGFYESSRLEFINYDIPINGLVYIQMTDNIFANVSMGGMLTFSPTNVHKYYYPEGVYNFYHRGVVKRRTGFCLNASIGFEWRTEKNGFFYFGGTAVVPVSPIFTLLNEFNQSENNLTRNTHSVKGSFASLDFRFYFPNVKNKGTQFVKGPIE